MRRVGLAASILVLVLLVLFVGLNLHELAHTVAARLAGDDTARYSLYHWGEGGGCIGCNWYDPRRLSFLGNLLVTVAGTLATQVVVVLLIAWSAAQRRGGRSRLTGFIAAGTLFTDLPLQALQGLLAPVGSQHHLTRVDFADSLYLMHQRIGVGVGALKAAMVSAVILYAVALLLVLRKRGRRALPAAAVSLAHAAAGARTAGGALGR